MFSEYLKDVAKFVAAKSVIFGKPQRVEPELCAVASFADMHVQWLGTITAEKADSIAVDEQNCWRLALISSSPTTPPPPKRYSRAPPG